MSADFWIRLALAALIIIGVWTLFLRGMLLERWGDVGDALLPVWARKPLYGCTACMSSIYGTAIYFATGGDFWYWPAFCLALCGALKLIAHNFLKDA